MMVKCAIRMTRNTHVSITGDIQIDQEQEPLCSVLAQPQSQVLTRCPSESWTTWTFRTIKVNARGTWYSMLGDHAEGMLTTPLLLESLRLKVGVPSSQ